MNHLPPPTLPDPRSTPIARAPQGHARTWRPALCVVALATGARFLAGCSHDPGVEAPNAPPETTITSSVPANGESVHHILTIFYLGTDVDGTVRSWEYLVHTYPPSVASLDEIDVPTPADDDPRWTLTDLPSVELLLTADVLRADPSGDIGEGRQDRWHTFFVRAIDTQGAKDPEPAARTFNAYTTGPQMFLQEPLTAGEAAELPVTFALHWDGFDDGRNGTTRAPLEVRWALVPVQLNTSDQPVNFPDSPYDLPEEQWSGWFAFAPPDTNGIEARFRNVIETLGDSTFVFVVQGRDDAGAVTPQFKNDPADQTGYNMAVLKIRSDIRPGPHLLLTESFSDLGSWMFDGVGSPEQRVGIGPGPIDVVLTWGRMIAEHYGGSQGEYRYQWNEGGWSEWSRLRETPLETLDAPTDEKFELQARDNLGTVASATLVFERP